MQNIEVHRYPQPTAGYVGYLEPEDKSWIAFIDTDGRPKFYLERDPETGAVIEQT